MKPAPPTGRIALEALAPPGIAGILILAIPLVSSLAHGESVAGLSLLIPFMFYFVPAAYAVGIFPSAAYAVVMEVGYHLGLKQRSFRSVLFSAGACSLAAIASTLTGLWHPENIGRIAVAIVGLITGVIVSLMTFMLAKRKNE